MTTHYHLIILGTKPNGEPYESRMKGMHHESSAYAWAQANLDALNQGDLRLFIDECQAECAMIEEV